MINNYPRINKHLCIIKPNGTIDLDIEILMKYLKLISSEEKNLLLNQYENERVKYPDELLINSLYTSSKSILCIDLSKYKVQYYQNKLKFKNITNESNIYDSKEIKNLCIDYMRTMKFIINYYVNSLPDAKFSFNYHYGPFASDIINHIDIKIDHNEINKDFICNDFGDRNLMLTTVLPPDSFSLLDKTMVEFINNNRDLYNYNVEYDYAGCIESYEKIVITDLIDINKLEKRAKEYGLLLDSKIKKPVIMRKALKK